MDNPNTLSKQQLLDLVQEQSKALAVRDQELAVRDQELSDNQREIARDKDIIRQLEEAIKQKDKDYLKLWRERFEAKSERYIANPDQLRIDFGDTDQSADAADGLAEAVEEADLIPAHLRRKPKKKSNALPAHLPRVEQAIDIEEADKTCPEHGEKQLLPESMWDVREKLVMIPPKFEVHVRKYMKYACQNQAQCGIASAERPTGIVEGDKYDTSVATQIITHKYAYFLTLYRLQNLFAGSGWAPSRGLMLNILTNCHFIIEPLLAFFKQTLLRDSIIACDDTSLKLLYPKVPPEFDLTDPKQKRAAEVYVEALKNNKPSINAKMWAYRGVSVKLNLFDFTVSRHRDGPELFFDQFTGTILGDCWHGFGSIAASSDGAIVRAACNAHARRKFENATDYPADRKKWMDWFWLLYDLESEAKEQSLSGDALLASRRAQQKPVWDQMRAELDALDDRTEQVVLPKSDLRKALNYVRNHWTELTRYLDDDQLLQDNNLCEQLMREVSIGRKNWLFAGSLAGGERNAGFLTLVSSAHRNDLDVWAYVDDVLKRLLAGETNYEPMLPWNWAKDHPESIRTYRQDERSDREIRKRDKRQRRRANQKRQAKLKRK
ncbi:MAG: IS66 family transposase [Pirellulaceae bacterium]